MSENEIQKERNWAGLDQIVLSTIFMKIGATDILEHAQFVCKSWRNASFNPLIWKEVDFTTLEWDDRDLDWEKMTREAVDRSKSLMEDLRIYLFGSDDLLSYVADRTNSLKRLRVASAYGISDYGLIDIAKKQPQLEELDITFGFYSDEIFEEIGKACPNLRCFRYNQTGDEYEPMLEYDEYAYDIADNMPELRVLQLVGNPLTNKGIIRILDKCKHLESLDIRCCFHVDVNAEIEAKAKGLKEFRLPLDSSDTGDTSFGDYNLFYEAALEELRFSVATLFLSRF